MKKVTAQKKECLEDARRCWIRMLGIPGCICGGCALKIPPQESVEETYEHVYTFTNCSGVAVYYKRYEVAALFAKGKPIKTIDLVDTYSGYSRS